MYFVVCVGLCWVRVGTRLGLSWAMLGHFGPYWHGLMLGHLGLFWDMCRPLSWIWAFQCR